MKNKVLLLTAMTSLVVSVTAVFTSILLSNDDQPHNIVASEVPTDPNAYDNWCDSWAKQDHAYFHYNRGSSVDVSEYENYCLWLWNQTEDTEGTLWAFSGNPVVSSKLTLIPMSTQFMTRADVGLSDNPNEVYKDDYGVIVDVDLKKSGLKSGKSGSSVTFDGCSELGLLWVKQSSMNGTSHWTSDGGREIYVDDWLENKRNNNSWQLFFSTGALNDYTFRIGEGGGIPEVKINPMNDDLGAYSSKTEKIADTYGVSPTSKSFKSLGIGYQIFVASFRDSNGDGYGDIRGIIDSLDYFVDLGVDVLWLTPIQQSDSYHGYDISDYYAVDKRYGTIDDYRELIFKAHKKGIKVLMDLVLNHTSKGNVWFTKSQWGVNSGVAGTENDGTGINWRNVYTWKHANDKIQKAHREPVKDPQTQEIVKYIFNGAYDKVSVKDDAEDTVGASWYRDGESNYYYYGKFGSGMPEINYENKDTRKLVIDMAKYWLSFGLDGFRLDAVKHIYMKDEVDDTGNDKVIRDVGWKRAYDDERGQYIIQPYDYSSDQTKNVAWWKEFAGELKKVYPDCFLVGENFDGYGQRMAAYYQGLDSQFDFANYYHIPGWFYNGGNAGSYAAKEADETYNAYKGNSQFTINNPDESSKLQVEGGKRPDFINGAFTSNHDVMRAINQANGVGDTMSTTAKETITGTEQEIGRAKVHAAVTLLNPGISWIYYGDELGMSSNTETHKSKYGNENSMDIWYRQPFLWNDTKLRAKYKSGQYQFNLDSYNSVLSADEKGITLNNGNVSTTNSMYDWYKDLCYIKSLYPTNAQINFDGSSSNVLVMNIWGEGKKPLKIFINIGYDHNPYIISGELVSGFTDLGLQHLNSSSITTGSDFGQQWYAVKAYVGQ